MPKGYWVGRVDVTDPQSYKRYVDVNGPIFAKYGAKFLVRGGAFVTKEGKARARNVVLEFPTYEQAMACYDSPEYQEILKLRINAGVADILVIEGYEGPQPA